MGICSSGRTNHIVPTDAPGLEIGIGNVAEQHIHRSVALAGIPAELLEFNDNKQEIAFFKTIEKIEPCAFLARTLIRTHALKETNTPTTSGRDPYVLYIFERKLTSVELEDMTMTCRDWFGNDAPEVICRPMNQQEVEECKQSQTRIYQQLQDLELRKMESDINGFRGFIEHRTTLGRVWRQFDKDESGIISGVEFGRLLSALIRVLWEDANPNGLYTEDEVGRYALEWGKKLMKRMGQKNQMGPGKITEAAFRNLGKWLESNWDELVERERTRIRDGAIATPHIPKIPRGLFRDARENPGSHLFRSRSMSSPSGGRNRSNSNRSIISTLSTISENEITVDDASGKIQKKQRDPSLVAVSTKRDLKRDLTKKRQTQVRQDKQKLIPSPTSSRSDNPTFVRNRSVSTPVPPQSSSPPDHPDLLSKASTTAFPPTPKGGQSKPTKAPTSLPTLDDSDENLEDKEGSMSPREDPTPGGGPIPSSPKKNPPRKKQLVKTPKQRQKEARDALEMKRGPRRHRRVQSFNSGTNQRHRNLPRHQSARARRKRQPEAPKEPVAFDENGNRMSPLAHLFRELPGRYAKYQAPFQSFGIMDYPTLTLLNEEHLEELGVTSSLEKMCILQSIRRISVAPSPRPKSRGKRMAALHEDSPQ